jgi:iron complex outermembrane receptor protein
MRNRGAFWNCASALALSVGAALSAGAAQAATAAAEPDTTLVITAERRTEDLQTAAISATVLNAENLEAKNVIGLTSLQFAAPGIQISDYSSANTFNIRGIGQSQVDIDLPSGVVIYRDGVPTLTGYFQNAPYYDMAGVEVLRGPQGTFVGKSAAAGAVFIRTRDPELGHFSGEIMLGAGNYDFFEDTLVLNIPAGDKLAFRVSFHNELRDDLFDSITTNPLPGGANDGGPFFGSHRRWLYSVRVGALWQPNEHFRAVLKTDVDYLHFGSHAVTGFDPATGLDLDISNPIVNGHHLYVDKGVRSSLKLSYDFDNGFKLNALSGFSTVKTRADWDVNGDNPAPFGFRSGGKFTNYSQEINLLSPEDRRVRFVGGLFWQRYENYVPPLPPVVGFGFFLDNTLIPLLSTEWTKNETSYAAFGQVAIDITPALELQLGGREGHYQFTQFTELLLFPGLFDIPFLDPPGGVHQKYSENSFDWKVNLNWKVNDDQFLYGTLSRGHTPGSINLFPSSFTATTGEHTAYKPMEVINYEVGWKGTFLDKRLRTQVAAYYQTYSNYQANFALPVQGISIDSVGEFKNAKALSKIYGVELSLQGRFGDLEFDAGLALSKSEIGSFGDTTNPFCTLFANADCSVIDTTSKYYGPYGTSATIDLAGARTPFAPEVTANAGVAYTFHLDQAKDGLTMTPRFDIAYRSDSYANLYQNPSTLLKGPTLLNLSVRFESGPWWASVWCTNLTDKRYPGAKQNVGVDPANGFFNAPHIVGIVYTGPPRLIGVRVGRSF